jgi:hypothetical protein
VGDIRVSHDPDAFGHIAANDAVNRLSSDDREVERRIVVQGKYSD